MNLLDVLPGWPEADVLSNLEMILLLFVGPALLTGLIALLVMAPKLAREKREQQVVTTEVEPRRSTY